MFTDFFKHYIPTFSRDTLEKACIAFNGIVSVALLTEMAGGRSDLSQGELAFDFLAHISEALFPNVANDWFASMHAMRSMVTVHQALNGQQSGRELGDLVLHLAFLAKRKGFFGQADETEEDHETRVVFNPTT